MEYSFIKLKFVSEDCLIIPVSEAVYDQLRDEHDNPNLEVLKGLADPLIEFGCKFLNENTAKALKGQEIEDFEDFMGYIQIAGCDFDDQELIDYIDFDDDRGFRLTSEDYDQSGTISIEQCGHFMVGTFSKVDHINDSGNYTTPFAVYDLNSKQVPDGQVNLYMVSTLLMVYPQR